MDLDNLSYFQGYLDVLRLYEGREKVTLISRSRRLLLPSQSTTWVLYIIHQKVHLIFLKHV